MELRLLAAQACVVGIVLLVGFAWIVLSDAVSDWRAIAIMEDAKALVLYKVAGNAKYQDPHDGDTNQSPHRSS